MGTDSVPTWITDLEIPALTIDSARTADELLTVLAAIKPELRFTALSVCGIKILREAADLCGIDSVELTKKQAITAITENF